MPKVKYNPIRFAVVFVALFACFYYFNIFYLGITSPGNHYSLFLDENLNYIQWLRWGLLFVSKQILLGLGFTTITNDIDLLVAGRGYIALEYSCLGMGVMSFLAAFTIAYPKPVKEKVLFLTTGILVIQLLNIARFVILALYWKPSENHLLDHHTIFNAIIYTIIMAGLYFWIMRDLKPNKTR
jgi:exosortase/archaeosortase family protein